MIFFSQKCNSGANVRCQLLITKNYLPINVSILKKLVTRSFSPNVSQEIRDLNNF